MSERIDFKVTKRDLTGKKAKLLRTNGIIPGVAYGASLESVNVQADELPLEKLISQVGTSTPLDLVVDGKKHLSIIKNIDRDAVSNKIYNIEFQIVSADEEIETDVPIRLVGLGESAAERAGFVVMQVLDEIALLAKPADMIPALEVDIKNLTAVGDNISISDITLPSGVEFADKDIDPNLAVANVYDPAELEAANEAAGGDATDVSEVESEKGGPTPEDTTTEAEAADSAKEE